MLSRRPAAGALTLVTATDGNHGRAVARMARLSGQRAHVFVPGGVHPMAVAAIAAEGAQVTEIAGTYDEAVRLAAEAADQPRRDARPGRRVARLRAGARPGSSKATRPCSPRSTMQLAEAGAAEPALVVIPAGVGSLAQAGITHYRSRPDSAPQPC